jgi:hypothetical protein
MVIEGKVHHSRLIGPVISTAREMRLSMAPAPPPRPMIRFARDQDGRPLRAMLTP